MSSILTRNLVNLFHGISDRDLNKSLTFDAVGGRFSVDRHTVAGSKSLNERTFITAQQTLTAAGDSNLCVRMQVANALRAFAGGGEATEAQRAFFEGALRDLLGINGPEGEISLQIACKPLEMRVVKQLLTKAEGLFALSGLQGGMAQAAATAADLTVHLNETAALNGKGKVAAKLTANLERDLAALGARLAMAQTEAARTAISQSIDGVLRAFNAAALAATAKMTSLEAVAQDALARYAAKGGETLGDVAQMRFIGFFARTQLEPGMNVKKFRAKLLDALPGFVDGLRPTPPGGRWFGETGVNLTAFTQAEQAMRTQLAERGRLVAQGKRLTATPHFELGAEAFDRTVFLRGGFDIGASYHEIACTYREQTAARTDVARVSVRLDGGRGASIDLSRAPDRASKAGLVSGFVLELCAGNRAQTAGVLAALGQRADLIPSIFARELARSLPGQVFPGFAEGNAYAVSRDADGTVLVTVSTVPESSLQSSITLRIGLDGTRSVVNFSGVKTRDAFADEQEVAARRARLAEMLPVCRQSVEATKRDIATRVAEQVRGGVFSDDEATVINRSAGVGLQGLVETLETLAANGGPAEKDFSAYQTAFDEGVAAIRRHALGRVDANADLATGVKQVGTRLQTALKGAAANCRANNAALAEQLDAFAAKVDAHLKRLQSDFYLSDEDLQGSAAEIVRTLETFAARIEEQARGLPAKPATSEDVAKYATLLSAELPRATYSSVSQEAREKLIANHALVSCAEISRIAKGDPSFGSVARSVETFTASVNDLLARAEAWPQEEDRQEFGDLVRTKADELKRAVADAHAGRVVFDANGVEALLKSTFDAVADAFRARETGLRTAELDVAVAAARTRLDDLLARGQDLSDLQREALRGARARLDAYSNLVQPGTLPSRESVKTLAFQLGQEVERFVGQVFDPSTGARAKRFFSGFKGLFAKQDPGRLFPFNPPEAVLAEDLQTAHNPFGNVGMGSLDALNRLARASRAVTAAIDANPSLLERALSDFEGLDGAGRFLEMDEDGNVHGFKVENGRCEGRELVETTFRQVVQEEIARLAAPDAPLNEGVIDVDALATPEWKETLLDTVRQRLVTALEAVRNVEALEAQPAQGPLRPGEVHERGSHVFGLNVDRLTPVEVKNLKRILISTLLISQNLVWKDLQRRVDETPEGPDREERQRQVDDLLDRWIREATPIAVEVVQGADGPTLNRLPGNRASRLSDKLVKRVGDAILTGRLALDEPLTLETCHLLVELIEKKSFGEGERGNENQSLGLGSDDPAEVLNALRLNGIGPEEIDRLVSPEGGNFSSTSLAATLDLLFHINRRSVNGLDSLAVRLLGKHLADLTEADYHAFRQTHDTEGNLQNLDPLFQLQGAERRAADFFLRTGLPTTEFVAETRAIYDAVRAMEGAREPQELALTYAGRAVTLKTDGEGHLEMVLALSVFPYGSQDATGFEGVQGEVPHDRDEDIRETRDVRFLCPLNLQAFRRQIEDEMSRNVPAYGAQVALDLLSQDRADGAARQLALNVIAGTAGTLATELCNLETEVVVDIARSLLTEMRAGVVDAKAFVADRLAHLALEEVVCFNGKATLESYRRMERADPHERDEKVVLPEQRIRREGETVQQARLRQVHAFVSELVMPNDTTKYDLERRRGASESDILRRTLLTHRYELGVVLRTLGGPDDLLDSFSMVGGDVPREGGEPPRMNEMAVVLKTRMGQLKGLVGRAGGMDAFLRALEAGEDAEGVGAFLDGFAADIARASDSMLAKMQRMLTDKLSAAFRQSMAAKDKPFWKQTLEEISGSGTLDVDSGYGQFLMESLATYFTRMEPIDRHRMASALFRFADSRSNSGELLGALIKGAGPVLQKLMQGLPQTALPDDLRAAVADLKSQLPPIAPEMVRATLLDMVEESNGYITKIELVRSFGAATVGQTFLCRVHTRDNPSGEECVLKLLRPDVQNRARRERALFLELAAKNPTMKDALRARIASIFDELDFTVEANNVKQGAVYNSGVVRDGISGVRSMELYPYLSASANVMVLRKAPGTTYDRYVEETTRRVDELLGTLNPVDNEDGTRSYRADGIQTFLDAKVELRTTYDALLGRQRRLCGFVEKWTYEVFFGDGFFHGDLHAGNIMCDDDILTVIDYGNAQRLTKDEIRNLKWALAWIPARDPHNFLDYYREILSPEGRRQLDAKRGAIEAALTNVFERGNVADIGKMVSAIFQVIQQNGVELPGAIFCILQSMQRLDESLRLMNEQLARVETAFHALKLGENADAENGPSFVRKIRESFARGTYPLADLELVRGHFGEGLSVEEMAARVDQTTPYGVVKAMTILSCFGGAPTTEEVIRRYAELPPNVQNTILGDSAVANVRPGIRAALIRPEEGGVQIETTAEEETNALIARLAGENREDAAAARLELERVLQEIRDFAISQTMSKNPAIVLQVPDAMLALDELAAALEEEGGPNVEGANAKVRTLYENLLNLLAPAFGDGLNVVYRGDSESEHANGMAFEAYADPSEPFGDAVSRGSKAFLAELIPTDKGVFAKIGGGLTALAGGGLAMRDKFRSAEEDAYRRGHRVNFFRNTAPWATFLADHTIYQLEAKAIQGQIDTFCFSSEVLRDLQKTGWVRDRAACGRVKEALRFNLDRILDALRAKGFAADVDNAGKRAALIQYAMSRLAVERPEWFRSLKGARAEALPAQLQLGDDADMQTAFACLCGIANGQPPVNDALTANDKREIDDHFRII